MGSVMGAIDSTLVPVRMLLSTARAAVNCFVFPTFSRAAVFVEDDFNDRGGKLVGVEFVGFVSVWLGGSVTWS